MPEFLNGIGPNTITSANLLTDEFNVRNEWLLPQLHALNAMNTRSITFFAVAVCLVGSCARAWADLPAANQVARYERCDSGSNWREVPKSDGEIVLTCLRDINRFKSWGSTVPPNIIADPMPTTLGFRIVSISGETNIVHFSRRGELVDCSRGLLEVPNREEQLLSELLAKWRKEDSERIASRALPCKYRIGTANDGGTLSGIAKLFYGKAALWQRIYEANKTIIKNPNLIYSGTLITIPNLQEASD